MNIDLLMLMRQHNRTSHQYTHDPTLLMKFVYDDNRKQIKEINVQTDNVENIYICIIICNILDALG
jgi:hypothetical protein